MDETLGRCDACIVEYYKARKRFLEGLRHEYEEDQVVILEKACNERDFERIKRSLDRVERKLCAVEPPLRTKNLLEASDQFGLFEALCNESFLLDDFLVSKHLQSPFSLVQTNKKLIISQYVPAITIFLFGKHYERRTWASSMWSRYRDKLTAEDFDFAVRDSLLSQMQKVYPSVSDPDDLERMWDGMGYIVDQVDNSLVTHSLRALDIDLFMLALDNLKYDSPALGSLLQSIRKLLELAPKDFWDAMGAISPTTFIEQVFNNTRYDRIMEQAGEDQATDDNSYKDLLTWIKPLMASLEHAQQAGACRSLTFQLLSRLQADRFPAHSRTECLKVGLVTLAWTLSNCHDEGTLLSSTGRVAASETLEVASEHSESILNVISLPSTNVRREQCGEASLGVIKSVLALDCKCLKSDYENLRKANGLPGGNQSQVPKFWDAVISHMDRGNMSLAKNTLLGVNDLIGLEKFKVHIEEHLTKEKSAFNVKLGRLNHQVCQILERINDFNPSDLDILFSDSRIATTILSSLCSPDVSLYEAGVNLIKTVSSESARKEAIAHLLKTFLATTLNALSYSMHRIAHIRTYESCPRMLKLASDVLDLLCNSHDGLLRMRVLQSEPEIKAVSMFWEQQWRLLGVIYDATEQWGQARVADSSALKEFCRDTMQFSERLFTQYDVFANALDSSVNAEIDQNGTSSEPHAGKGLLRYPVAIMVPMLRWLRLRDRFLLEISAQLTKQILNRLTEAKLEVSEQPAGFLEKVVNGSREARTNLTPQEKAEIARALERNLGRSVLPAHAPEAELGTPSERSREHSVVPQINKDMVIDLDSWSAKAKSRKEPKDQESSESDDSGTIKKHLSSVSRSVEMMNRMKEQQKSLPSKQQPKTSDGRSLQSLRDKKLVKGSSVATPQTDAERAQFREKREEEREAKRKRDAQTLAMVKKKATGSTVGPRSGATSGIGNLGVKGKDHAPKGPSMMVSSDSDSDSDELDEQLFGRPLGHAKVSDSVLQYEKQKSMQVKSGPVKKVRQGRSAKDMRARLAPDLTPLHKRLLGWEFFHQGEFPPGSKQQDYSLVSNTFRTPNDYCDVFEPLLMLEAWQGILKSKDEGNFKTFELKVASRMNVDAFLEISTTMQLADAKDLGIGEADIILISKGKSPVNDKDQPHCLARACKTTRKKGTMEITYKANVGNELVSAMVPNATLYATKVDSITPLEREYGALLGLKFYDLCDEVVRGKPSPLLRYSDDQIKPVVDIYKVNPAQAKAVKSAVDNDAFTLIQGPPGSGKTKTIVAIVGALLTPSLTERNQGLPINRPQSSNNQAHRPGNPVAVKKLLVCAPSNAAVDELVMRFKQGVKDLNGKQHKISIVRLGRSDAINSNVMDVTLEELVNAKLNIAVGKTTNAGDDIHKIMMSHKATSEELNLLRDTIDSLKAQGKPIPQEQIQDLEQLKRKKQQLSNQIDSSRDKSETVARDAEISRRRVQQDILDNSHVICATLSGSGHEMFQGLNIEFETVVIDEAAQSIELSALIPLKYGCSKCVLVGDPKQLPPTVLSREAARFQYEQSLFVRMQSNHPQDIHLLDVQYRMHPNISVFPSNAFYEGKLLDGPGMEQIRTKPWHSDTVLSPYRFFDVGGMHQSAPRGHSLINNAEIEVALKLYQRLLRGWKSFGFSGQVGIITPYKSQLRELKSRFAREHGEDILTQIDFNTTDSFQGRESEVIIFSCVRASNSGGIGFLSDIRRMNVGITRAKSSLWVLGNSQSLMRGEYWSRLIQDAKHRNLFTSADSPLLLQEPQVDKSMQWFNSARSDQDVEMPDAPTPTNPESQGDVKTGFANNYDDGEDDKDVKPFEPSGGGNGLNGKMNCTVCGSSAHMSHNCDNAEALEMSYGKCHRCGIAGHPRKFCKAELCITCGRTGHTKEKCTSSDPLMKKDQDRLARREREHAFSLQVDPEVERRKQLGSHDPKVPVVRTTQMDSPSDNVKGNSGAGKGRIQSNPPQTSRPASNVATHQQSAQPSANGHATGDPLHDKSDHHRPTHVLPAKPEFGNPQSGRNESLNNHQRNHALPGKIAIQQGDAPPHHPKPGVAPVGPSQVRPPKRKRDADPFIRPKKK